MNIQSHLQCRLRRPPPAKRSLTPASMPHSPPLPQHLSVRVYGVLLQHDRLLLSRENIRGRLYTKFPGGGLELGEGPRDTLIREFQEEAALDITPQSHLYTTEDYIPSAFDERTQVLSIYYWVSSSPEALQALPAPYHRPEPEKLPHPGDLLYFWQPLNQLKAEICELPLDRRVIRLLQK